MSSVLTAAAAAALLAASAVGRPLLAVAVALVQLVLIGGWFRAAGLTDELGARSGAPLAAVVAIGSDVALLRTHPSSRAADRDVRVLAIMLAALVVLAFVGQLVRRGSRVRLTDALAATVASGAVSLALASLLGVRAQRAGAGVVAVALVAVAVGVLPVQARLARWWSLPLGLALATGAGALVGGHVAHVGVGDGAALGAVAGAVALAVAAGGTIASPHGTSTSGFARRQLPLSVSLPLAVVMPPVLVIGRILVG